MENSDMYSYSGFIIKFEDKSSEVLVRNKITLNNSMLETAIYHQVVDGERLDQISYKYYGNNKYWWVLADVNDLADDLINPFQLQEGLKLIIPKLEMLGL
jgi:hypothetical protein